MDPIDAILAVNSALNLVQSLLPILEKMRLAGQITVEQQAQVLQRYDHFVFTLDTVFDAPAWRLEAT